MEINERASTTIDCPLSPTTTIDDELKRLAEKSSDRLNTYIQGQIQGTVNEYKLLEEMNTSTAQRYTGFKSCNFALLIFRI